MPKIINSDKIQNFALKKINRHSSYNIFLNDFKFKTNYNLANSVKLKEIKILNKNKKQVLLLNDIVLNFKPLHFKPYNITINYLYFNKTALDKDNKSNFDFESLPQVSLNKAEIILQKDSKLTLYNIKGIKEQNQYSISFKGFIQSKYLSKNIQINSNKNILIKNKSLIAHNAALVFNNSPLILDGVLYNKKGHNFFLQGIAIPTQSIKEAFLFYRKQIKPFEKNFIENFYDFKGTGTINLNFKNKGIYGWARLDKFQFKSVKFSIPFYYPKSVFYFNKDEVSLKTEGLFGKEKLYTDYFGHNIFSKNRINEGTLISIATDDLALNHLPDTRIVGTPDLKVKYIVQHRKPKVFYTLDLKQGEDISHKNISLNSIDKVRQIKANTIKIENKLYLKNYTYFIENTATLLGHGEFTKKNNKFHLDFITLETVNFVPTKILGKYSKYIADGKFKANLIYCAKAKELNGNLNLKLNKFNFKSISLNDIDIKAICKKNLINFSTNEISFARGILNIKGNYNIKNKTSDILFNAANIDSNTAADEIFKLKNQFEGLANAKLHLTTLDNFKTIKTRGFFTIEDGKLTKLGSSGFFIQNSKFKIEKFLSKKNIEKLKALDATIHGQFDFDVKNKIISNIEIFNQNKNLSMFLEGCYSIKTQNTCLNLWGKYNKDSQKNIKIFHIIPLSWITRFIFKKEFSATIHQKQIEKIPPIEATPDKTEVVLINIEGNINDSSNLKFKLKSIK